jgi:outer membrane protein
MLTTLLVCNNAQAVNLASLHKEMIESSPKITAAVAQVEVSKARARQTLGTLLPQISFTGVGNRTHYESVITEDSFNGERYQLSFTQDVFNKAKFENKTISDSQVVEAEENYLALVSAVSVDLLERYVAVLSAEDVLSQIVLEKKLTENQFKSLKSMYQRQLALLTDVLDVEARLDSLAADEISAKNMVAVTRSALGELVGYDVDSALSAFNHSIKYANIQGKVSSDWVEQGLTNNHELKALRQQIKAAKLEVKKASSGHLPTAFLKLEANKSNIGFENSSSSTNKSYVASINLNVPIYSGGSTNARQREMRAELKRSNAIYEEKKRLVAKEIQEAYLNLSANVATISASDKAISSAEKSFEAMEKGFKYGTTTVIDVLDAKREVLNQEISYRKKQYDYATNWLNLLRLSGQFNVASIYQVNSWLAK